MFECGGRPSSSPPARAWRGWPPRTASRTWYFSLQSIRTRLQCFAQVSLANKGKRITALALNTTKKLVRHCCYTDLNCALLTCTGRLYRVRGQASSNRLRLGEPQTPEASAVCRVQKQEGRPTQPTSSDNQDTISNLILLLHGIL